jgi:hypothetical protein
VTLGHGRRLLPEPRSARVLGSRLLSQLTRPLEPG